MEPACLLDSTVGYERESEQAGEREGGKEREQGSERSREAERKGAVTAFRDVIKMPVNSHRDSDDVKVDQG